MIQRSFPSGHFRTHPLYECAQFHPLKMQFQAWLLRGDETGHKATWVFTWPFVYLKYTQASSSGVLFQIIYLIFQMLKIVFMIPKFRWKMFNLIFFLFKFVSQIKYFCFSCSSISFVIIFSIAFSMQLCKIVLKLAFFFISEIISETSSLVSICEGSSPVLDLWRVGYAIVIQYSAILHTTYWAVANIG